MSVRHHTFFLCKPGVAGSLFTFFFFNDTATTEIYTLSLHDALPICLRLTAARQVRLRPTLAGRVGAATGLRSELRPGKPRSEEHTSELQSHLNLVCRLLLEKKKNKITALMTSPQSPPFSTDLHSRHT